jgi:hypothetical protein
LPENARKAIDGVHELMMRHRRSLINLESMAPALLQQNHQSLQVLDAADMAAGSPSRVSSVSGSSSDAPLPLQVSGLIETEAPALQKRVETCLARAIQLRDLVGQYSQAALLYGTWPMESLAVRRGIPLTRPTTTTTMAPNNASGAPQTTTTTTTETAERRLQHLLDAQAAGVDRVERIPSPYIWQVLKDMDQRLATLRGDILALDQQLHIAREAAASKTGTSSSGHGNNNRETDTIARELASTVRSQNEAFLRVAAQVSQAHEDLERLRVHFRTMGGDDNIFLRADAKEAEQERLVQEQLRANQVAALPSTTTTAATPAAPAPAGGLFGATPAPAPAGGLFGAPAPAPAAGGLFGAPPAPAAGGLFGAPPAPAAGGLFGAPPAPAAGGLFGAPSAPAAGGLFGAPPAAAAFGTPAFKPANSSTSSSARSRNKSRSSRR